MSSKINERSTSYLGENEFFLTIQYLRPKPLGMDRG